MTTFTEYQARASTTAIYTGRGTPLGLVYTAGKLSGEAGELLEKLMKALRDDDLIPVYEADHGYSGDLSRRLTPERRTQLIAEAGDVLWYLSQLCQELQIPLAEVANANLCKLQARAAAGTLKGEGDNR